MHNSLKYHYQKMSININKFHLTKEMFTYSMTQSKYKRRIPYNADQCKLSMNNDIISIYSYHFNIKNRNNVPYINIFKDLNYLDLRVFYESLYYHMKCNYRSQSSRRIRRSHNKSRLGILIMVMVFAQHNSVYKYIRFHLKLW